MLLTCANVVIPKELAAFLESGLSITAGTRDADLWPDGTRAYALQVHEDREHLTAYFHAKAAPALLENLAACPLIALSVDQPSDSRACQIKGSVTGSRRARAAERALVERQIDGFLAQLETIGIPRAMTAGWRFWPCVAVDLRITHLFEATPGPGAGDPL